MEQHAFTLSIEAISPGREPLRLDARWSSLEGTDDLMPRFRSSFPDIEGVLHWHAGVVIEAVGFPESASSTSTEFDAFLHEIQRRAKAGVPCRLRLATRGELNFTEAKLSIFNGAGRRETKFAMMPRQYIAMHLAREEALDIEVNIAAGAAPAAHGPRI